MSQRVKAVYHKGRFFLNYHLAYRRILKWS
jgi:hypothetical protein